MKWPKEWLRMLEDIKVQRKGPFVDFYGTHKPDHDDTKNAAQFILERLHNIGALKDPPQPKEIWVCKNCGDISFISPQNFHPAINMTCNKAALPTFGNFHFYEKYKQELT